MRQFGLLTRPEQDIVMTLIIRMTLICGWTLFASVARAADAPDTIEVSSYAFQHRGIIPHAYSNYGDNRSIDIYWSNLPAGTVELALICDDPVVGMTQPFVHWVVYNIPATALGLQEAMPTESQPAVQGLDGLINGLSGVGRPGYFGPRPPLDGLSHEYHFRVYAIDTDLDLPVGLDKEGLLEAIEGHVLATGLLVGNFQRTR
jgi:Raf kinase inhibitor-like YbhB/YbcL family protein